MTFFTKTILMFGLSLSTAMAGNLDTKASSLKWTGSKLTGKSHFGTLFFKDGDIVESDGKWTGGSFVVDMNSMTVDDMKGGGAAKLLKHLKNPDFFVVEKFPTATLKVKSVQGNKVTADMTIMDKTNEVSFEYEKKGDAYVGQMKFDRTKYGVVYKSESIFASLGDKVIRDEILIDFTIQAK